jgi:hypothetical protein
MPHLLIAMLLLSACAKVVSDTCPRLIAYTDAEQEQAADELLMLPKGSVIARMIGDYGVVRNEIRVCTEG